MKHLAAPATLAGLVIHELRRLDDGLVPERLLAARPMSGLAGAEGLKRRVLDHALAAAGPDPLIAVGRTIAGRSSLPAIRVILNSRDTDVLAAKWMRMERYYHSAHRTRIDTSRPGRWSCSRDSRTRSAPTPAENLLICGMLTGLLEGFGASGVHTPALPDLDGRWAVEWTSARSSAAPLPRLSRETTVAARVARVIGTDPAAAWPLGDVAQALALSPRGLQRLLASEGTRYSRLLPATRTSLAADMLIASDESLAGIGFACGFADQAHFQRCFGAIVGVTPGVFRSVDRETRSSSAE